jgi:sugar phosphate isomerase/epimerase
MERAQPWLAVQLYTVRELTARDMGAALEAVAAIGFQGVELAGLTDLTAPATAACCARLELDICGAHVRLERFEREPAAVAAELAELGTANIVFPWLPVPSSAVEIEAGCAQVAAATLRAQEFGLRAIFHNHWGEFGRVATGERLWEGLTAIQGLGLEVDLGWVWAAGEDPVELLRSVAGRCPLIHLKDVRRDGETTRDTPLGDGELDWTAIVPAAVEAGAEWLIVEQDDPGDDPIGALRRSFSYIEPLLAHT